MLSPDFSRPYQDWPVQAECLNCGPSYGSASSDLRGGETPAEVVRPVMLAWVEERHDTTSANVHRMGAGLLVVVAPETAEAQVVKVVCSSTRGGDHVVSQIGRASCRERV